MVLIPQLCGPPDWYAPFILPGLGILFLLLTEFYDARHPASATGP